MDTDGTASGRTRTPRRWMGAAGLLGAGILETGQQYLAYQLGGSQFYLIAYALLFLLVMLVLPRGIVPTIAERLAKRQRRAVTA